MKDIDDFFSKENIDKFVKQRNTPMNLPVASGNWISSRYACDIIAHYCQLPLSKAETVLCRRANQWVPIKVSSFGRSERPIEGIDPIEFRKNRKKDTLSHFTSNPLPSDWKEVIDFFKCISSQESFDGEVGVHHAEWASGDFRATIDLDFSIVTIEITGLTFDEHLLLESIGQDKEAELHRIRNDGELEIPPEKESLNNRKTIMTGRPRAAYWEDSLMAIAVELFLGDLKPERQSDIENAICNWLAQKGIYPSESSIRQRARKFWQALNTEK